MPRCCRWNPTVEEQAIDRAHRIGQTRHVHVTRIIIKGALAAKLAMESAGVTHQRVHFLSVIA